MIDDAVIKVIFTMFLTMCPFPSAISQLADGLRTEKAISAFISCVEHMLFTTNQDCEKLSALGLQHYPRNPFVDALFDSVQMYPSTNTLALSQIVKEKLKDHIQGIIYEGKEPMFKSGKSEEKIIKMDVFLCIECIKMK